MRKGTRIMDEQKTIFDPVVSLLHEVAHLMFWVFIISLLVGATGWVIYGLRLAFSNV